MQSHQILPKHKRDTSFEKKKRAVTTTTGSSGLKAQCVQTEKRQKGGCRAGENGAGGTLQFFPPQASFPTHEKKRNHRHTDTHANTVIFKFFFFLSVFAACCCTHTHTHTYTHKSCSRTRSSHVVIVVWWLCCERR